jgi:mRNA interferase RelE/StbE
MSSYSLKFTKKALKEWEKLDRSIKLQFQKKLKEILQNPTIPANRLIGFENVYKIKLRNSGYRLAYEVKEEAVIVLVLKIGKRDKFYENLKKRTQ